MADLWSRFKQRPFAGVLGLFEKSDEEQRKERYQEYLKKRAEVRQKLSEGYDRTLQEGSQKIGRLTSGLASRFKSSTDSRAAALGRVNDTEAFEVPVVGRVANAGSNAMQEFQYNTGQAKNRTLENFDIGTLNADEAYADRPIEPGFGDQLNELAPTIASYAMGVPSMPQGAPSTQDLANIPMRNQLSTRRPQEIPVSEDIIEGIPTYKRRRQPIDYVDLQTSYYRR